MKVSVVIPVYNAEPFLEKAVESALAQEETAEIVLVEDGSRDGSLDACVRLEDAHEAVVLARHPDGGNHGAGATRNLGIRSASSGYIAFLDADDLYLPGRFGTAGEIFAERPGADGVYEAIGTQFEDAASESRWREFGEDDITTLSEPVLPERLFDLLVRGRKGSFSLDGLTVRREIFGKCGYFFENLELHQDTAMIMQMALYATLYPGRLETPVAMRRVHSGNRFVSDYNRHHTSCIMWKTLFRHALADGTGSNHTARLFLNYIYYTYLLAVGRHPSGSPDPGKACLFVVETFRHPLLTARAVREHLRRKKESG